MRELRLEAIKALSLRGDASRTSPRFAAGSRTPSCARRRPAAAAGRCTPLHGFVNKSLDARSRRSARGCTSAHGRPSIATSRGPRRTALRTCACRLPDLPRRHYLATPFASFDAAWRAGWPMFDRQLDTWKKWPQASRCSARAATFRGSRERVVADRVFREFFVFTFVRNPARRAAWPSSTASTWNKAGSLTAEAKAPSARGRVRRAPPRPGLDQPPARAHAADGAVRRRDDGAAARRFRRPCRDAHRRLDHDRARDQPAAQDSKPTRAAPAARREGARHSNAAVTRRSWTTPAFPAAPAGSWQQTYYNGNASACEYLGRWPWSGTGAGWDSAKR